jgi:hypothetical protein
MRATIAMLAAHAKRPVNTGRKRTPGQGLEVWAADRAIPAPPDKPWPSVGDGPARARDQPAHAAAHAEWVVSAHLVRVLSTASEWSVSTGRDRL